MRRRLNNFEDAAVASSMPINRTPHEPASQRPARTEDPEAEPASAVPLERPRRAALAKLDLGGLPSLPERVPYRRVAAVPAVEPIQQIKALFMKLTVQSYLDHVSEDEFENSIREIAEARRQYQRNRQPVPQPTPAPVPEANVANGSAADRREPMDYFRLLQQNLQRNPVSTSVATVPIVINNVVFEN